MIEIRLAAKTEIPALHDFYAAIGKTDPGYFEQIFSHGSQIPIVIENGALIAFCVLNWRPRYSLYKALGVPEIQDLNVLPAHRRRGLASALIAWCEDLAKEHACSHMGISVGLTKSYGPAQILYAKMGYVPDGYGATYDREGVEFGRAYPMDDLLALMLIKPL